MNLRDLHYLVTVADCGQFACAAKLCNVSQPSLSIQLKKLEEELGVTIFERYGRQLIVTSAGQAMIARAQAALREVDEMRRLGKQFSGAQQEFRLGIISTVAPYFLPHFIPRIRKAMPQLRLHLVEAQTQVLEDLLMKGLLDSVIAALPLDTTKTFTSATMFTERCLIAVPKNHRLASRKRLSSDDLATEHILLLDEGHCLRNQALTLCQKTGMQENTNFRATSLETLRHMVASGAGITLMPESAAKKSSGIVYLPCAEPGFTRTIGISWRASTPHLSVIEALQKLAKEKEPH